MLDHLADRPNTKQEGIATLPKAVPSHSIARSRLQKARANEFFLKIVATLSRLMA